MTSPFVINDLDDISFISGTEQELTFYIYDSGSVAKNLLGFTCTWEMARYGTTTSVVTKNATVSGSPVNKMVVTLASSDTPTLSGKFIHQPVITSGSSEYRPSQGVINIIAQIS